MVTNPAGHTTYSGLDVRGQVTSVIDPNSRVTIVEYDPLGRLTNVWQPGRSTDLTPNLNYVYTLREDAANVIATTTLNGAGEQVSSYALFDGRLRPRQIQARSPGAPGARVITDTQYDGRGLAVKSSAFWNTDSPDDALVSFDDTDVELQTRTSYDGLDRPIIAAAWSRDLLQWQSSTTYDGDRSTVIPPDGGARVTTHDVFGRATALQLYPTSAVSGTPETTSYHYDRLGQLTSLTDPAGNVTSYGYDLRGRRISTTDRDTGTSTTGYDDAGQVDWTLDGRGQKISYEYDNLGRQKTRWAGEKTTGTKLASYLYDTKAKGMLTSATRWVGADAYTFSIDG